MVTEPCFFAVTSPDADTVAMLADDVDHVTMRPVRIAPFALRSTAVACVVLSTAMVPDDTETEIVDTDCGDVGGATGGTTGGMAGGMAGGIIGGITG